MNSLSSAVFSKLSQGTALTALLAGTSSVYFNIAPDEATLPYVVFSYQSAMDENLTPRRSVNDLMYIRGYTDVSGAAAGNIATQIDNLFQGATITVTGWTNFWSARETEIENTEITASGKRIYNAGGVYRIRVSKE
jgi:hypothetical protein